MIERPILFSAPMVRSVLAGTKTQTRRVVKGQDFWGPYVKTTRHLHAETFRLEGDEPINAAIHKNPVTFIDVRCPFGQPGDRLWVRETFAPVTIGYAYAADPIWNPAARPPWKWHPGIHMPRAACRLVLEVTDVRVERLQAIGDADLECEGLQEVIDAGVDHDGYPRDAWRALWSSINGAESWNANPWVWAVHFRRIEP